MTHQMLLTQQPFLFALLTNHRCTRPTQIITMTQLTAQELIAAEVYCSKEELVDPTCS